MGYIMLITQEELYMTKKTSCIFISFILLLATVSGCLSSNPVESPADTPAISSAPSPTSVTPSSAAPTESDSPIDNYAGMSNDELRTLVENRYDVKVFWNAEVDYPGHIAPLEDEELIRKFLIMLDEQLALYPTGFFARFRELKFTVTFLPTSYVPSYVIDEEAGGIVQFMDNGHVYIALNASYWSDDWPSLMTYAGCPYIIYGLHHEIGHAIQTYIVNWAKGLSFNYRTWQNLLPPKYKYYDALDYDKRMTLPLTEFGAPYLDENQKGVWFCDYYAQASLDEHMASLFAYAMCPTQPEEWKSSRVQAQTDSLYVLIRQVFGTDSWPEKTHWERVAENAR